MKQDLYTLLLENVMIRMGVLGMSKAVFNRKLHERGCSESYGYLFMRGELKNVTLETLEKIALVLQIDAHLLLEKKDVQML